jgi:hypothetical protein
MKEIVKNIHYTLRFASAMCFIGHGAFGIITKQIWFNYFEVFGIHHASALRLMPLLGATDIAMGLSLFFYPTRIILIWLVIWGGITAALRPFSGEPFAELLERAGNYGVPLALLLLQETNDSGLKYWFKPVNPTVKLTKSKINIIMRLLKIVVFLMLTGHGWLSLAEKQGLLNQLAFAGISKTREAAHLIGLLEISAAILMLIWPYRELVLLLLIWKLGTEIIYPHMWIFEWIERGGSYGALLALWHCLSYKENFVWFKYASKRI